MKHAEKKQRAASHRTGRYRQVFLDFLSRLSTTPCPVELFTADMRTEFPDDIAEKTDVLDLVMEACDRGINVEIEEGRIYVSRQTLRRVHEICEKYAIQKFGLTW
jgi:hypothetical protein